ncbi:hypothetical protein RI367_006729 [Sorochytrium milnesiophthora]
MNQILFLLGILLTLSSGLHTQKIKFTVPAVSKPPSECVIESRASSTKVDLETARRFSIRSGSPNTPSTAAVILEADQGWHLNVTIFMGPDPWLTCGWKDDVPGGQNVAMGQELAAHLVTGITFVSVANATHLMVFASSATPPDDFPSETRLCWPSEPTKPTASHLSGHVVIAFEKPNPVQLIKESDIISSRRPRSEITGGCQSTVTCRGGVFESTQDYY